MKKIISLFLAFFFCTLTFEVQAQAAAEQTYSRAVSLMKKKNTKSLKEAIKLFRKAQIGFAAQDKKDLCQQKIEECQYMVDNPSTKTNKVSEEEVNLKISDAYFEEAENLFSKGDLLGAQKAYERARQSYPQSQTEKISIINQRLAICQQPVSFAPEICYSSSNGSEDGIEVNVKTFSKDNWRILIEEDWIEARQKDGNQFALMVTTKPNKSKDPREGNVTLLVGSSHVSTLKVIQQGAVVFSEEMIYFKKKPDGIQIIFVEAPAPWEVVECPAWVLASKADENRLKVECSVMKENERKGEIIIRCGEDQYIIPVVQSKKKIADLVQFWK